MYGNTPDYIPTYPEPSGLSQAMVLSFYFYFLFDMEVKVIETSLRRLPSGEPIIKLLLKFPDPDLTCLQ